MELAASECTDMRDSLNKESKKEGIPGVTAASVVLIQILELCLSTRASFPTRPGLYIRAGQTSLRLIFIAWT